MYLPIVHSQLFPLGFIFICGCWINSQACIIFYEAWPQFFCIYWWLEYFVASFRHWISSSSAWATCNPELIDRDCLFLDLSLPFQVISVYFIQNAVLLAPRWVCLFPTCFVDEFSHSLHKTMKVIEQSGAVIFFSFVGVERIYLLKKLDFWQLRAVCNFSFKCVK